MLYIGEIVIGRNVGCQLARFYLAYHVSASIGLRANKLLLNYRPINRYYPRSFNVFVLVIRARFDSRVDRII